MRGLVVGRLDLLAPDERSVVDLVAHTAQGLPHDVLESAGGLEWEALQSVVGHLVGAGLLAQEVEGSEVTYRLSHPLLQEVAASELPAIAGWRLHARLARTVERLRPHDLDRLAYHYSRAGTEVDRDRALGVMLEAGERAHGLAAHEAAAGHFGAALSLVRAGRRPELLALVLERLGESWDPLGEPAAAMEMWAEAVRESEQRGDALSAARLRRRLGMGARGLGDLASARRHLAAGVDILRDLPPSEELVDLHHARLFVDSPLFDPEGAAHIVAELSRLAGVLGSPRCRIESLSGEGALLLGRGDYAGARAKAEEALRIAEETGDWNLLQRAHRDLAWVTWFVADHDAFRFHAAAQLELDQRLGAPAQEPLSRGQFALADLFSGNLQRAVEQAEEAVAQARRHGQRRLLLVALGALAMARWGAHAQVAQGPPGPVGVPSGPRCATTRTRPFPIEVPPGYWQREASHLPKPVSPLLRSLLPVVNTGFRNLFSEMGVVPEGLEWREIGGWVYTRVVPPGGKDRRPPPRPLGHGPGAALRAPARRGG